MDNKTTVPGMIILVVEDDQLLNMSIRRLLDHAGFVSEGFLTGNEVLERVFASPDNVLLLLDYSLPDLTAKEIVEKVRAHGLEIPFVIITGHGDEQLAVEMMKLGALDYFVKSLQFHEIVPAKLKHISEEIAYHKKLSAAENTVRQAALEWQKTFDSISDAIFILDLEQRIIRCNEATFRLFGKSPDEVIGKNCCTVIHGTAAPVSGCPIAMMKRSLVREYGEVAMGDRFFTIAADPIFDSGNVLTGAVHVISDITERKRSEQALLESEERFRLILEHSPIYLFFKDEKIRAIQLSRNFEKMLGRPLNELIGKSMDDLFPSDLARNMVEDDMRVLSEGKLVDVEEELNGRSYQTIKFPIQREGRSPMLAGFTIDITERKQAEEARRKSEEEKKKLEDQLRQSQKLEAIGQLAGGVAHDFNNLLGGIMGNAELIKMRSGKDSTIDRYSDTIINSSVKAADLTRQLLTFARKARINFTEVDIHTGIENVIELLKHTIDRKIEIIKKFGAGPSLIKGDSNMIENALLNIAINARDAMPLGGTLTFITSNITLTHDIFPADGENFIPGAYVSVAITDTGTGMDAETRKRIFEPFFTTKEAGKGTGLGLAAVYGCVHQHDGHITVQSTTDVGTTFTMFLPEYPADSLMATSFAQACVKGHGRVMVIDDDQIIGDTLGEILNDIGYSTVVFCDPLKSLDYFGKNHGTIDAVVLDLIMPKMSGLDLFRAFKKLDPAVKVVVASGYSDEKQDKQIMEEGVLGFIQKPYRLYELSEAVAKVIGREK